MTPREPNLEPLADALPKWAMFLVRVGFDSYCLGEDREKFLATCITVPDRTLAAAMVAVGATIGSLVDALSIGESEHFSRLAEMPQGTPVAVHKNGTLRSGWLVGRRQVMGLDTIAYEERTHGGSELRYLVVERSWDIQPMPQDADPFVHARPAFESESTADTLETILTGGSSIAATQFSDKTAIVTTLVDFETDLKAEITISGESVPVQDLVRADRWAQAGVPARTRVVPSSGETILDLSGRLVVFDGAAGYLRRRHEFDDTTVVALLDRWDSKSQDAAHAFLTDNAPYADRLDQQGWDPVPGMEVISYQVSR